MRSVPVNYKTLQNCVSAHSFQILSGTVKFLQTKPSRESSVAPNAGYTFDCYIAQ